MKKVMVYAYTKFNLGDDLFIKILCERYPDINFVLYAPREYKLLFKEINNITIFPSDSIAIRGINFAFMAFNTKDIFRKLVAQSCDVGVYIGGSLFIQEEKWREGLKYLNGMKIKNKSFFLLGANFGPFKDKEFYLGYKNIFREYSDICFREKYSFELFNDLGNVRLADDIIFQLKREHFEKQNNNIVISVIKPSKRKNLANKDEIYYKKIKELVIYFIEKGYVVTLMSFCELEGDKEAVEQIWDEIPKEYLNKVNKHFYKLKIEDTLKIIAQSSFVVATRFHSMILGWLYNKPVFPIVYSEKMTNVMKDVGFNGLFTDLKDIAKLDADEVYKSMKKNVIDVSKQVKNSERHFEKLDQFLKE